ncbi:MAG: transglutaminase TgpA family protein [Halohasta sp.]
MSDGRQFGEAVLVIVAIVAVLLSAAFLPLVDVFGAFGVPGGGGPLEGGEIGGGGGGGGEGGEGSDGEGGEGSDGEGGEMPGGTSGSPVGGSLATSEETAISGGFDGEVGSAPLFVVDSPEDTYWRQTAYTRYTGTGWDQSAEDQPIDEGVPNDDRTVESRSFEYDVTLLTDSQSLPTAWQPDDVDLSEESETTVRASTVGGISTDQSLPKNTTYTAESSPPPRDAATLREADGTGPTDLQETYTQLPDETPDRVGERTDEIVAGEPTRYDTVMETHDWLESNRGYSLETDIDPNEPIADQLLFEVDEAYCQHFATTMVAMLRSQDIPARYVVGFSGGRSVGDDEYLVTSDRAHAWVEVYFEDVGWVRFDPTPGGEMPVESFDPPYNVSLNRSAVVGADVAVSVDKNDSAVSGAPVYVNDERVGWTDGSGEVTTTLPYAEDVTVTARPPGSETKYSDDGESSTTTASVDNVLSAAVPRIEESLPAVASSLPLPAFRAGGPAIDAVATTVLQSGGTDDTDDSDDGDDESSASYTSETNATVSVGGDRTAGGTATVVVTVQDVPVEDADIAFDGETVGSTDSEGSYELSLEDVEPGNYSVTASREPVEASSTVTVSEPEDESDDEDDERDPLAPNVSVEATPIALPGGPATATVSRDDQPISGTEVRVDDTAVGETDANGTVEFSLPITDSVVVAASANGVTGEASVDGLYRNAGGLVAALVGSVVGLGALARRYGLTRQLLARKLAAILGVLVRIPHRLTALVIRLADAFEAGLLGVWRRLRSLPSLLSGSLADVLRRLSPRGLLVALVAWLQSRLRGLRRSDDETGADGGTSTAPSTDEHRRLRAIWGAFVEFVRPPKLTTRTPGEIGRYAIRRGLPRRPVEYITDLYRAAEYGRRSPDDSRLESAREALSAIRDRAEDDE